MECTTFFQGGADYARNVNRKSQGGIYALSWLNLLFGVSAYVQRVYLKVDFLELGCPATCMAAGHVSVSLKGFDLATLVDIRRSESSTLSDPALEPLIAASRFNHGLVRGKRLLPSRPSGTGRCYQCASQHDESVRTPSFGRVGVYILRANDAKPYQ